MRRSFKIGDQVIWWKQVGPCADHPYRAEILAVKPKRIRIQCWPTNLDSSQKVRWVSPARLERPSVWYSRADQQGPAILEPSASWGKFSVISEVGNDVCQLREIREFSNGYYLSYDRKHWIDEFGMMGSARINRNRNRFPYGTIYEISANEFERIWKRARKSPIWPRQRASAQMKEHGSTPFWLAIFAQSQFGFA